VWAADILNGCLTDRLVSGRLVYSETRRLLELEGDEGEWKSRVQRQRVVAGVRSGTDTVWTDAVVGGDAAVQLDKVDGRHRALTHPCRTAAVHRFCTVTVYTHTRTDFVPELLRYESIKSSWYLYLKFISVAVGLPCMATFKFDWLTISAVKLFHWKRGP